MLIAALVAPTAAVLNAPAIAGAGLGSLVLADAEPPAWLFPALAAVLAWITWYIAILCIELRTEPVRLVLTSR
jgi:hypothetical protein